MVASPQSKQEVYKSQPGQQEQQESQQKSKPQPYGKDGKTHPARQNHTTRRHLTPCPSRSISPRRGRSRSPSSSTRKIVQSSLKHQSPPPWFAAKEDRDLFSQQQLKTAASSQDAHVSNRGGRGKGRGRGRGQPSPRSSRSPPRNLRDQRGVITTKAEVEGSLSNTEETEEKFGEDVNLPNTVGERYPRLVEALSRRSKWTNAY